MLGLCPEIVERSLDEAQKSLKVNFELVETILQLRATNPDLKFYVLSNISKVWHTVDSFHFQKQ